jgi:hypothetical protein
MLRGSAYGIKWKERAPLKAILKPIITACLTVSLAGCAAIINGYNQAERQKALAKANAEAEGIMAECVAKHPLKPGNNAKRLTCAQPGYALLRPFSLYPDLFDQLQTNRLVLAERTDAGQITPTQAAAEDAQLVSQMTAEEQRRILANRAVGAQEAAAAAQQSAAFTAAMQTFQPRQVNVDMTVRRGY